MTDRSSAGAPVRYRVADGVATITFDRPEARNAITFAMRDELAALLERAGADPAVRVVVLEGAGGAFTAGVDVHDRPDEQDPAGVAEADDAAAIAGAARALGAPVGAAPARGGEGPRACASGWGLELALHADLVVAADDCRFFFPSIRNGSGLPDSSMALYHLGPQWAKRLLLTGDEVDGRTAERIGLVVEAVPDDELDAAVDRLARRLAAVPPEVAAASKRVLNHAVDLMGRAALQDFSARANARAPPGAGGGRVQPDRARAGPPCRHRLAGAAAPARGPARDPARAVSRRGTGG